MKVSAVPGRDRESAEPFAEPAERGRSRSAARRLIAGFRARPVRYSLAVVLGLGAGLSPLFLGYFSGYFSQYVWPAAGLCVVVAALVMAITGHLRVPSTSALAAIAGLAGLGLLTLASALWSPAPRDALVDAARVLAYAAVVVVACGLARGKRRRVVLLGAMGLGLSIVALVTVARLLGPGASSLFLAGRLSGPLGYAGGTACAFVLGAWLFLGLAVRPRPLEAAAGTFGAVLMACLAVLAESRSGVVATLLAAVAVLIVQGHARTIWALVVSAAGVAVAFPVLAHTYSASGGHVSAASAHAAGVAAVLAGAGAAVVWGVGAALTDRVRARGGAATLRRASRVALATLALLAVVAAGAEAGGVTREAKKQWHAFSHLSVVSTGATNGESRLLLGGGPVREYWRVALDSAAHRPVAGPGAGSWTQSWFQNRHYFDPVWQPNSILFGTVGELGGLGALLVAVFVVGVALSMWAIRRRGQRPPRPATVAAVGVAVASLSYATTDWIWVGLPGVMAIGLVAIGVVLGASSDRSRPDARQRRSRQLVQRAWRIGVVALSALAVVLLGRVALADGLRASALRNVVADPPRAVDRANASLSVDPDDVQTYYVKAAALARLGQADAAHAALMAAARRQPDNYVTWALAGDLDVRRHDLVRAQTEYGRAARLDPLDTGAASGIPTNAQDMAQYGGPRPPSVDRRQNVYGYQIIKDTSPLELARALGAPGLRTSDQVVVGLFGYGVG